MQAPLTKDLRRRRFATVVLGILVLLLLGALALFTSFKQISLQPSSAGDVLIFTAITSLVVLLFVAIFLLFIRNLLKLYADQKNRVLGSRLRWRMLVGALLISFAPILFMFFFSYGLMNRSVDRWFSQPVTELRNDSNDLVISLSNYSAANARVEAAAITTGLENAGLISGHEPANIKPVELEQWIEHHAVTLQGGFAIVYRQNAPLTDFNLPQTPGESVVVKPWLDSQPDAHNATRAGEPLQLAILHAAQRKDSPILSIGTTDYTLGFASMPDSTTIVTGIPLPAGMGNKVERLRSGAASYWQLLAERRMVRANFMALLLMITTLAFFASSWLALHIAKQVTRPAEALADAMDEIAAGHYAHRVAASATTELGELVNSFNHMAEDLESSRIQADASTRQLSSLNTALETRRVELETLLETIPNGVVTLDTDRRILQANRAFSEMINPGGQQPVIGRTVEHLFPGEAAEILERLFRRSHRMGVANGEMELHLKNRVLSFTATVALLETDSDRIVERGRGYVLVLEDVTELLRAQKQVAWKEVARRVAHEIKNP
jgi:PAS domain S-box-containing protein